MKTKRLRVFAGPNGSGKSTLFRHITENYAFSLGYFVNADEIEKSLLETGNHDFSPSGLHVSKTRFLGFVKKSAFAGQAGGQFWSANLQVNHNRVFLPAEFVNSYFAALVADFLREEMLAAGLSFTFETVFSDGRKLDFLKKAKLHGYRIYLYFVATDSPEINWSRVEKRVASGGHNVPREKVFSRYKRSLDLLPTIIGLANRAFLFDNSEVLEWVAEITESSEVEFQNGDTPDWIYQVLEN